MNDIERTFARVFSTGAGMIILNHLKSMTIERVLGANATDAELRTLEGQRALVRHIETLITRGRQ